MTMQTNDSESRATDEQIITACAFIHHEFDGIQKVFLAKRAETKKFRPGVYELVGGHVEFGEDIVEGLKREIREELGASIDIGDPFAAFTYTNAIKGSHSVEVVYFATLVDGPESIDLNPEDHSAGTWFAEADIANAYVEQKGAEDIEFQVVNKGFALLRGESPKF